MNIFSSATQEEPEEWFDALEDQTATSYTESGSDTEETELAEESDGCAIHHGSGSCSEGEKCLCSKHEAVHDYLSQDLSIKGKFKSKVKKGQRVLKNLKTPELLGLKTKSKNLKENLADKVGDGVKEKFPGLWEKKEEHERKKENHKRAAEIVARGNK